MTGVQTCALPIWKRHGLDAVLDDERETTPITTREQFILAVMAVVPDRADGVNDPLGGKFVTACDFGLTRRATAERAAFRQQLRPGGAMDGAIHTAAAEQCCVGGIHHCLHALLSNVASNDSDAMNGFRGFRVQLRNWKFGCSRFQHFVIEIRGGVSQRFPDVGLLQFRIFALQILAGRITMQHKVTTSFV